MFKVTFLPFYYSSWYCSINTNKTKNLLLLSLWTVSAQQSPLPVPVWTIPTQDQESLSAPGPDCLCQEMASSWFGGSVEKQDSSTQSWSCESWIFYGNFTVRWGPNIHIATLWKNRPRAVSLKIYMTILSGALSKTYTSFCHRNDGQKLCIQEPTAFQTEKKINKINILKTQ